MNVKIKSVKLENFKGAKDVFCDFGLNNATVSGANATGKTTVFDAVWWALFNKDSLGNEKFSIRPLDAEGQPIHNVEIKVTLLLYVDGTEMEFCKTQKEKWVKKRGTETAELQGNENLYEINGYPKTEKDYKAAVSDLVSEEVFEMLTSPTYFTGLKWKEQRDILMRFVSNVNDYDLADGEPLFIPLLKELANAPSLDDIRAKFQKALSEWKKKQIEIPVRIDEAEKSKVLIDAAELELGKIAILELIKSNKSKQEDLSEQYKEHELMSDGILELKFKLGDLERKANAGLIEKRRNLHALLEDLTVERSQIVSSIDSAERNIFALQNRNSKNEEEIARQRKKWTEESKRVFDDSSLFCPYCKQEYTSDKKEQLKAEFESHKANELESITAIGNNIKKEMDSDKKEISMFANKIESLKKELDLIDSKIEDTKKELESLPTNIDVAQTDEYKSIAKEISDKEVAMKKFNSVSDTRHQLMEESTKLGQQLIEIERKIASFERNVEIDERISQLQTEQRDVAQKVANQEKMIYILEEFIRYKMDKVSADINSVFDGITWKLFSMQINGGLRETCECMVDGVPYGSLNNGHRIVAGLQIIKALQKLYNVQMPIFVDNSESINDFNLPQMDSQLILLKVSDDKELSVV